MAIDYLAVEDVPMVTVGSGRPWDIFFFVSEISTGATERYFNSAYISMPFAYRKLGIACAKTILAQRLGLRWAADANRFIVARIAGQTSGAALLREIDAAHGEKVLLIDFLAVTPAARRRGVGRILVEYAQRHAPAGGVECYCAPESRPMQRLLKRLGFARVERARAIGVKDSQISLPSRWIWRRKG
nr:GNAT family N-acetyltransferase [Dyella sp. ASV24]